MKVLFVVGSYPPDACGVGDYTSCLVASLKQKSIDVAVLTGQDWSIAALPRLIDRVKSYQPDIVHMQYPALGFGYKLGPQLLSIAHPIIVTIHEASQAHILRRLSLYGFSLRSQKIIFTTESEKNYALKWCPWVSDRTAIIPIGANVPVTAIAANEKHNIVGYFGLIRPMKGLEQLIKLASILQNSKSDLRVRIIGRVVPGLESYHAELRAKSHNLPIEWCIDADDSLLAHLIGSCKFAYLPFPDGASERRASLIAFMEAGACIVTTRGEQTSSFMEDAMKFSTDPEEAVQIMNALKDDLSSCSLLQDRVKSVSERFSWSRIAQDHLGLYHEFLNR